MEVLGTWELAQYSYSYFQRFIVTMTSDYLYIPLTVPNLHNSVGVSSKPKLLV